jgi:hypothetical protein
MVRTDSIELGKQECPYNYPSIDTSARRDVWISKYLLNIPSINFDYEILNFNQVEV